MTALAIAWALLVAGATLTALLSARARRKRSPAGIHSRRIVLVRPCAGHEDGLDERLATSGGADVVLLAVESSRDPAARSAHRAARVLEGRGTSACVVHTNARGPNRKVAQLAEALDTIALGSDDAVVVADSDVDLEATDLYALVAKLDEPRTGAAWAPPVEAGPRLTRGDRLARAVLSSSLHAFPFLAGIDGSGMVGKLFVVRASALADIDGFAPFVDRLGEDVAIGRALRRAGWKVRVAPVVAPSVASGRSPAGVIARLSRWVHVVRRERPWLLPSYPLLFAPTPIALLLVVSGVVAGDRLRLAAAALVLASRFAVAELSLRDVVLGDAALLAAFARALWSRSFEWRGRALRIGRGGRLEERTRDESKNALGEACAERRPAFVEDVEVGPRCAIDARELGGDGVALLVHGHGERRIVHRTERRTDRDPEVGSLRPTEHVTNADRQNVRERSAPRDVRSTRSKRERRERGALLTFGIDPDRTSRSVEKTRRVTNCTGAVARIVEIDPERADEPEERQPLEVSGIHHRVGLELEEVGDEERDERVPPGRVVRDDQERLLLRREKSARTPVDEDATERGSNAPRRLAGEPTGEEPRATRGNHRGHP